MSVRSSQSEKWYWLNLARICEIKQLNSVSKIWSHRLVCVWRKFSRNSSDCLSRKYDLSVKRKISANCSLENTDRLFDIQLSNSKSNMKQLMSWNFFKNIPESKWLVEKIHFEWTVLRRIFYVHLTTSLKYRALRLS